MSGVMKHNNSTKKASFKTIAEYALLCLCLPVSNAVAEKIFSYVTCVKRKQHNRMKLTALGSIVKIEQTCISMATVVKIPQ